MPKSLPVPPMTRALLDSAAQTAKAAKNAPDRATALNLIRDAVGVLGDARRSLE